MATKTTSSFKSLDLENIEKYVVSNTRMQLRNAEAGLDTAPLCVTGPPGIGKSQYYQQICKKMGWGLSVQYMSLRTIEQLSGLPMPDITLKMDTDQKINAEREVKNKFLDWSVPLIFDFSKAKVKPNPKNGEDPIYILLLDDYHLTEKMLQKYLFQLLTYRGINDSYLPNTVAIHLAGNRQEDKAGFQQLNAAVVNRMWFLDITNSADAWIKDYAIPNGVRTDVITFIDKNPHVLSSTPMENTSWASPRSWAYASDVLNSLEIEMGGRLDTQAVGFCLRGLVGNEATGEFIKYWALLAKWDAEDILAGRKKINYKKELEGKKIDCYSLMAAVMGEFIRELTRNNFKTNKNIDDMVDRVKDILIHIQKYGKPVIPLGIKMLIAQEQVHRSKGQFTRRILSDIDLIDGTADLV